MLPQDPQDLKYDEQERNGHDDEVGYSERRAPGIGAIIAALVLAAAIIYCVWYFVAADETDDADLPAVDVTVDVDEIVPGS